MSLQTPNQLHAGLVAFFQMPDPEPPEREAVFTVTAQQGLASIAFPPAPTFSGDFTDGLMLRLTEPVHPAEGVWFVNGWESDEMLGLTPTLLVQSTGEPTVDLFASEIGNWLTLEVEPFVNVGFFTLSIFELPQIDTAEVPHLPMLES